MLCKIHFEFVQRTSPWISAEACLDTLVWSSGATCKVYAMRQAIAKGIVAYWQKFVDEASKKEIKDMILVAP